MSPKKRSKKRKTVSEQNTSSEKPNKKQSSTTHTLNDNVHNDLKRSDSTILTNMTTYNVPTGDSSFVSQNRQYVQQFTMPLSQTMPNPNFNQQSPTSPLVGYLTSTPQTMQNPVQPSFIHGAEANIKLDTLAQKVDEMCKKLSSLDILTEKLNKFDKTMQSLVVNVEKVTKRVNDVEKSMDFINSKFEINQKEVSDIKHGISDIRSENEIMNNTVLCLNQQLNELNEKHLDLQTRSMRENLIFTGIPMEDKNETSDATEKIIEKFMREDLKMEVVAEFHRAHRFGKEYTETKPDGTENYTTRPIVCRFTNFKERERVRSVASELKGTRYGISEQFPKEINDRRKALWPYFQEAKKQKKKAVFRRDRLFVEGREVFPPDDDEDRKMDTNVRDVRRQPYRKYEEQGARPKEQRNTRRMPPARRR